MLVSAYSRRYELIDAFENLSIKDANFLGQDEVPRIGEFIDNYSLNIRHHAIIDSSSKLVGYVAHNAYKDWGVVSFDRGNPTVVCDTYKLVKDMLYQYEHFYCFARPKNPANKAYSSFANKFDGVISKPSSKTGDDFKYTIKSKRVNAIENFINDIIKPMEFKISEDSTFHICGNTFHIGIESECRTDYRSLERYPKLIHELKDSNEYIYDLYSVTATYSTIEFTIDLSDKFYKSDYYINARGPVLKGPNY